MTARHRLRHPTVRTLLSNLRARRRRVLGTGASVLLGVSFLVAALSFGSTVERGFAAMYDTANRATDVVVRSATVVGSDDGGLRDTIAESLADIVRAVPGVARVAPAVLTDGQLLDPHGARIGGNGPPTFAGNWVDDDLLNPYRLAEGRAYRAYHRRVELVASAKLVGMNLDRTNTAARLAHIIDIHVDEDWRNRNVGKWLVRRLLNDAALQGYQEVLAFLPNTLPNAMALFMQQGFVEINYRGYTLERALGALE